MASFLWIISDCILMMSIQRYMKNPTSLLQVIPLYISKLLSKWSSVDILTSADQSCLSMKVWRVSMTSIQDCIKPYLTLYRSLPLYKVSSGLTPPLLSPKFLSSAHSYHTSPKNPSHIFQVIRGGVSQEHWNCSVLSEEEAQNWLLEGWPFGIWEPGGLSGSFNKLFLESHLTLTTKKQVAFLVYLQLFRNTQNSPGTGKLNDGYNGSYQSHTSRTHHNSGN